MDSRIHSTKSKIESPGLLNERYERRERIGSGSYGIVYKCIDRKTGAIVAIKKWKDSDKDMTIKRMAQQEVDVFKLIKHPNVLNLIDVFRQKKRLYFVLEYCEETALNVIEKYRKRGVPIDITKPIMWQTLQALSYFHEKHFMHRDIKPENILVRKDGVVKLCDFNFARVAEYGQDMTDYVATRWYRAPELLVGDLKYDSMVDVWAVGCVYAEFVTSEPLWPGKSDLDQLFLIRRNLGDLLPKHMECFKNNEYFFGLSIPDPGTLIPIEKRVPKELAGFDGVNFLKKCIDKDPSQRSSCKELLNHSYFKNFTFKYPTERHSVQRKHVDSPMLPQLPGALSSDKSKNSSSNKIRYR